VVVVDAAQSVPHFPVDVRALGCDFLAFSGHKLYGPTGIGVLWGRPELLDRMPPAETGGGMVDTVTVEGTTWAPPPARFEAGTPPLAEAVGLAAAIEWLSALGLADVGAHEHDLVEYATGGLAEVPGLRLLGGGSGRASVLSFLLGDIHPHDVATVLDAEGVAVRAGHHCAQPLMRHLGLVATVRASFAVYNTREDVDHLLAALEAARRRLRP
jgi:cysteine desulfurase/selenocysteine lyase